MVLPLSRGCPGGFLIYAVGVSHLTTLLALLSCPVFGPGFWKENVLNGQYPLITAISFLEGGSG